MSGETDPAPTTGPLPSTPSARQVWQFRLSMVILFGWILFLAATVWRTANPVLLSRPQILSAAWIVEGNFKAEPVRLEVIKVWRGEPIAAGTKLEIAGFAPSADFRWNIPYLVPLELIANGKFRIAETPAEPGIGTVIEDLLYPATESSRRQLRDLLESRDRLERKASKP